MATHSFLFKGWAITIAAALSAFAAVETKAALLIIAVLSTIMFWALDGYYLWLERGFIRLHNEVTLKSEGEIDFSMIIDKTHAFSRWLKVCRRPHLWAFYGTIIIVDVIAIFALTTGKPTTH